MMWNEEVRVPRRALPRLKWTRAEVSAPDWLLIVVNLKNRFEGG